MLGTVKKKTTTSETVNLLEQSAKQYSDNKNFPEARYNAYMQGAAAVLNNPEKFGLIKIENNSTVPGGPAYKVHSLKKITRKTKTHLQRKALNYSGADSRRNKAYIAYLYGAVEVIKNPDQYDLYTPQQVKEILYCISLLTNSCSIRYEARVLEVKKILGKYGLVTHGLRGKSKSEPKQQS